MTMRLLLTMLLTTTALSTSCTLRPYEDGTVRCSRAGAPCPTGYACLPGPDKADVCREIGCGDGQLEDGETCDDGNDNLLDECVACAAKVWSTSAVGFGPGDGEPSRTRIGRPTTIASDASGNIFIGSIGTNAITRLDAGNKRITTFAGNGSLVSVETGTAAPPNEVTTVFASALAIDGIGNVFFSDLQNAVIRRIDAVTGDTTVVAGNGVQGSGADNVPGTQTSLDLAVGLAVDGDGNLFIAEKHSGAPGELNRIRRLDRRTNIITTVVAKRGDNPLVATRDDELEGPPDDIAFAPDGTLIVFTNAFDRLRTEPNPSRQAEEFTVEATVAYTVTTLTLDSEGRFKSKKSFDLDLRVDLQTFVHDELGNPVEKTRVTITELSSCVAPDRAQERIAVSTDGKSLFHPAGHELHQLTLPTETTAADCIVLAEVPGAPAVTASALGDAPPVNDSVLVLVPTDVAVDPAGGVLFADPANGVVWRFESNKSNQAIDDFIGQRSEVPAGVDPVDVLIGDLVLEFAKQTDGHLGAGLTEQCKARDDDGTVIENDTIDFEDFEFFAPFPDLHRLVLSDCNSSIAVIAGTGEPGFSGDGGLAINAQLSSPTAAVRGPDGDIYIADRDNNRIRRLVIEDGEEQATKVRRAIITTFIGEPDPGDVTAGAHHATGDAADLDLDRPSGLAVDHTGALLIADASNLVRRVVMVDSDGEGVGEAVGDVTTIFGVASGGFDDDDHPADQTQLIEPASIVFLPFSVLEGQIPFVPPGGLLVVAERSGHRIRATIVPPFGTPEVYTLAGTGEPGNDDNADGTLASFVLPRGVMASSPTASAQKLGFFVVDAIDRVRTMDLAVDLNAPAGGLLSTSVGTATANIAGEGLPSRDDGIATGLFRGPGAVTFLDPDTVAVIDTLTGRLRTMTLSTSSLRTVAGMPAGTIAGPRGTSAFVTEPLRDPGDVVFDGKADEPTLWVSEAGAGRLRRFVVVDPQDPSAWRTSTVTVEGLVAPAGLALDPSQRTLYVTDKASHVVVSVDLALIGDDDGDTAVSVKSSLVAGVAGRRGFAGEASPAAQALLNEPAGVAAVEGGGRRFLYIADTGNNRVRRVDLDTTTIDTILGDGNAASGGEGAPSKAFPVDTPRGLAVDVTGNLYVTSASSIRLVQAGDRGFIDGESAVTTIFGSDERDRFPEQITRCLEGLALSTSTSTTQPPVLYAVDSCIGVLLRLERNE